MTTSFVSPILHTLTLTRAFISVRLKAQIFMKRYFQRSAVFFSAMTLLYHVKQFKKNAVFFSQTLDIISFLQVHISRGFIAILYNITIALPIIRVELTFLTVRVAKAFFGSCRLSSPDRYRHYLECATFSSSLLLASVVLAWYTFAYDCPTPQARGRSSSKLHRPKLCVDSSHSY